MQNGFNRRSLMLGAATLPIAGTAMAQQATITGAGATFPRPLYERWSPTSTSLLKGLNLVM